jgi:pimeloyl-ACP methyl ester carboxylesterase
MNSWYIPFILHYQRATPALVPGEGDQQIRYFPVEGGSIRGCISRTEEKTARRPLIFLSGWGTSPELFRDVFTVIHGKCDYYYLETREKASSSLEPGAKMDMDQFARDVADAIEQLGLGRDSKRDYVILGTSWGAAVLAHGLARGYLNPPTAVLFDPMPRLWIKPWIRKLLVPLFPVWFWNALKGIGRRIALAGMKEATQRARAEAVINSADLAKWKAAVRSIGDYDALDIISAIPGQGLPRRFDDFEVRLGD